jgi:hypothetical protein
MLLDLGCGPTRDLKVLADRGHLAISVDGASPGSSGLRSLYDQSRVSESSYQ